MGQLVATVGHLCNPLQHRRVVECHSPQPADMMPNILMPLCTDRTIQDPASQRLTWNKSPASVLVIKKIHDSMVVQPFLDLVQWLIWVSPS